MIMTEDFRETNDRVENLKVMSLETAREIALEYYNNLLITYEVGGLVPSDDNPNIQALQEKLVMLNLLERVQDDSGKRMYRLKKAN
jgi:hypothetical protein